MFFIIIPTYAQISSEKLILKFSDMFRCQYTIFWEFISQVVLAKVMND